MKRLLSVKIKLFIFLETQIIMHLPAPA